MNSFEICQIYRNNDALFETVRMVTYKYIPVPYVQGQNRSFVGIFFGLKNVLAISLLIYASRVAKISDEIFYSFAYELINK
jgi:hypothetical protein